LPTILVVEDDHLIQSVVEEALKEGGFEIVIASTAEHAAELLDSAQGKYRALVSDINLGRNGRDGWEVARRARQIDPAFPVVYMSGDSAEDWASKEFPTASCWPSPSHPPSLSPPLPSSWTPRRLRHKAES
jgi:CheY-like chemotaxis protein